MIDVIKLSCKYPHSKDMHVIFSLKKSWGTRLISLHNHDIYLTGSYFPDDHWFDPDNWKGEGLGTRLVNLQHSYTYQLNTWFADWGHHPAQKLWSHTCILTMLVPENNISIDIEVIGRLCKKKKKLPNIRRSLKFHKVVFMYYCHEFLQ